MADLLTDYLPIIIFLGIATAMGIGFLVLPAVVAPAAPDKEKNSAYECGFNAFDDARMKFDVRFYLVSILFIIFDLEIAFLFPFAASLLPAVNGETPGGVVFPDPWFMLMSMLVFLGVLTVGLVYEWRKGALEWE
jgi:NADH-quinone oxidoreductase subunit A